MKRLLLPVMSWAYKRKRAATIRSVYKMQDAQGKPRNLEDVVRLGDDMLRGVKPWAYTFPIPEGIGVDFYDLHFDSPLTLAAFKGDVDIIERWLDIGLGGACTKTIMPQDRDGNKEPRIQEITVDGLDCLINAMGLPGPGVDKKLDRIEGSGLLRKNKPIGFSIGGSSLGEYKHVFDRVRERMQLHPGLQCYFEVNISCPNTPDGQQMGKNPALLDELLNYMRAKTDKAIGVKLSPDMTDQQLSMFALFIKRIDKTYVNLGNTTYRKCEQVGLPANAISIGGGGMSGPALYNRTHDMVKLIAPLHIPIIATGGIDSAEKVKELQAIAKPHDSPLLIGMATAVVKDMYCIPRINYALR